MPAVMPEIMPQRILALIEATHAAQAAAGTYHGAIDTLARLLADTSRQYQIGPTALSTLTGLHSATIRAYMRTVTGHTDPRLIQDALFDLPEPQPALPDTASIIAAQATPNVTANPAHSPAQSALPAVQPVATKHL